MTPGSAHPSTTPFRMWVESSIDSRTVAGVIASGDIKVGERVKALPSAKESRVARIALSKGDATAASAGQSVTLTLADVVEAGPGDMLAAADAAPSVADQFNVMLAWTGAEPLFPGRPYRLRIGTKEVGATITEIKYKISPGTREHIAAKSLELNDTAIVNISLAQPIPFDPHADIPQTGTFTLIERTREVALGSGMIHFALRRAENIHWQAVDVNKAARAGAKQQKACVLWFTGLSGAGKSTIANLVEKQLFGFGRHTYLLDGDNVRHGLNRDLGFTETDRVENIRRVAEVAKLMTDAGLIVLVSFISPFRAERQTARDLMGPGEFVEVFVDTPLELCEARDVKGLYAKARAGNLPNFTGIDSPYEPPEAPELRVIGGVETPEAAADRIVAELLGGDDWVI